MTKQAYSAASYWMVALLAAAMTTVLALGWIVARDFQQLVEAANQLYDRFGEGLDMIDNTLFETGEVRRILLYALHTSDANRQLEYVDQSRLAERQVRRLLERDSPMLSTQRTRMARESVAARWTEYLQTRDEVVGLILEGSLRDAVALDEETGTARFNQVRGAIADLKASFEADAAAAVEAERARSSRAITRLAVIVASALVLLVSGVYLASRRASLETVVRVKSDFLATMSHELRTPLTGVIGITDLLQAARVPAEQRELVRMLRTNATTLLGLVNNVLDYSRIDAALMTLAPRQFSITAPVEEALDAVSELAARKGLGLGYVIAPTVPDVIADEERVRQVLINLLSNAVKYTDTGQVAIHVDAQIEHRDAVVVAVRVTDTGIGIREELQGRLFQWFSQIDDRGKRAAGGTGLGLAISARLSRLLGGSISVASRPGEGSTFTFVFRAIVAVEESSCAADAAKLVGTRALLAVRPGIVRDQIRSLLRRWHVENIEPHDEGLPSSDVDVVIADADASQDAEYGAVMRDHAARSPRRVPMITIAQMGAVGLGSRAAGAQVVARPVRMQALHEALCVATGGDGVLQPTPTAPTADASSLAVLLVEDNESNRRVVSLMLGELGFKADEAAGGHDAVDCAAHRNYDVILMDVQMPDLDGLEATRRIRAGERDSRATIVALTANVFESDEARCRAAGMNGYLQKPLSLDALSHALNSITLAAR